MADNLQDIVPVENPDSRRDLLAQQLDEIEQNVAEPAIETPAAENRPRNEAGRYAKVNPEADQSVEEPVWKRPPASWKREQHEVWNAADPRMQEYAYQREEQMRAGVAPFQEKARYAEQMQQVIEPYMQTIQGLGIQPYQAVGALMNADYTLRNSSPQDRLAYFARLAQSYGVDLSRVGELPQQSPVNSIVYDLQNELNTVRGEVESWKNQQEQAQNTALLGEIDKFSQTVDYFEEARPAMIQLLQGGMAEDLQDAYNKAVRIDPNLFDTVNLSQQAEMSVQKRAAANRAAKSARAAAVSVRSSTPGAQTTTKTQDRRSLLAEQFDAMNERL